MADSTQLPRILAIHAHPDDIEFQCAGALARLRGLGCPVTLITMTAGDCGSAELGPDEIAKIRRDEAQAAADLLGAEYDCLGFHDLSIIVDNDSRRRVTEAVRRVRPDLIITAPPTDYMCDHEATSRLVRDACFTAPIPNYSTGASAPSPPCERIPHLFYVDAIEGTDYYGNPVQPEFIVDVSSTFDLKRQMLACHDSQRAWLRKQHGIDEYLDRSERWSALRGEEIGVRYGEGFTQHRGHPYPGNNLLLELLKSPG
ncbi:MAG: PIG-L family deacetylase [Planctomycetaceae bacterium]|jgi:N-acetylglucosamine malate deacetylase 1|nr:PIG-L family deacetylase [Planctomycetaceae bacterium]MBT6157602.1 PIG-L family deacetylase [Planctomycetaceae bacterium]MBT6486182.1 PIG-L family deacetylase [Planctomycetaceae bacterium]MBT6497865.1 PIG-L family deacetylase [Planctomycetaceae bacterium]